MPDSSLVARGAQVQPVPAAPLYSNRFFSGLWTQSSPLRDAATPYLYEMFYSASRFERMIGGQNIEISTRLTPIRRPGNSVYNSNPFPIINRFYEFRGFSANGENIKVMASINGSDGPGGGTVRDVTGPANDITIWNKNATAGKTCFLSVGNELFFADGIDAKKYLQSGKSWMENTVYTLGDFIIDTNGNIQSFQAQAIDLTITELEVVQITLGSGVTQSFLIVTLSQLITIPPLQSVTFSGVTGAGFTSLNGQIFPYQNIASGWGLNLSTSQIAFVTALPVTATTASAGTAATRIQQDQNGNPITGTSGATEPTWNSAQQALTQDGTTGTGVTWTCFTSPVQDWSPAAPTVEPVITPGLSIGYWSASRNLATAGYSNNGYCIIDANGQYQVAQTCGTTGTNEPIWNTVLGGTTKDGSTVWINVGTPSNWIAGFQYTTSVVCLIDPNGNLQFTTDYFQTQTVWTAGVANTNGATNLTGTIQPTWTTAPGETTTDGVYTWTNAGPAQQLSAGTYQYAYSYHSIDGSVSTASPVGTILNAMVGYSGLYDAFIVVPYSDDPQIDQIWIWRTAGGQSQLVYLDQIPNLTEIGSIGYHDTIPDTTTSGQQALDAFISAPINDSNDPPPVGFVPQAYHLGRIFGYSVQSPNVLQWSGGPDTVTGNGNTAFPPDNTDTLPSSIAGCWSTALGLIVFRTDGITIVLGNGTSSSPIYSVDIFDNLGVPSQDAFDTYGNNVFLMTTTGKVVTLTTSQFIAAVQGEVSQQLGNNEIGFPIGDTFYSEYTPSEAFVVWHEGPSEDSGLFVADGTIGWYNLKQLTQPEVCAPWSPRATIVGGCGAIASIEIVQGVKALLISPGSSTGVTAPIMAVQVVSARLNGIGASTYVAIITLDNMPPSAAQFTFAGLTGYTALNGQTIDVVSAFAYQIDINEFQFCILFGAAIYPNTADTGTATGVNGPILMRDLTTNLDNRQPYETSLIFGSVVLAQPGTQAAVEYIVTETTAQGSQPTVGILVDEITGNFTTLEKLTKKDPPNLPASLTAPSQRAWAMQSGKPIGCRHIQVQLSWPAENFANELLTYTIYGRLPEKARR